MNKLIVLLSALLAVMLLTTMCGDITAPMNMFSSPTFSMGNTGFNQLSTSDIGKTPILFAPSTKDLFSTLDPSRHFMPHLTTQNWTSSMKTSGVNQMFAMLSSAVGKKATSL